MGRPKKVIDYALAEKLAYIQCTIDEIAVVLEISDVTLRKDKRFLAIHKKGLEQGKSSLRRLQWKGAEAGNPTMLIWLGKQYLGQKDKSEVTGQVKGELTHRHEVHEFTNGHLAEALQSLAECGAVKVSAN